MMMVASVSLKLTQIYTRERRIIWLSRRLVHKSSETISWLPRVPVHLLSIVSQVSCCRTKRTDIEYRSVEPTPSMPNVTITSSLSFFNPQFTAPYGYWPTFYELYRLTVPTTDDYIIECHSSLLSYILLYSSNFDASAPSSNLITSESGDSFSRIRHNLESSEQYYLVITVFYSRTTMNFSLVVKGPAVPVLTKLTSRCWLSHFSLQCSTAYSVFRYHTLNQRYQRDSSTNSTIPTSWWGISELLL